MADDDLVVLCAHPKTRALTRSAVKHFLRESGGLRIDYGLSVWSHPLVGNNIPLGQCRRSAEYILGVYDLSNPEHIFQFGCDGERHCSLE